MILEMLILISVLNTKLSECFITSDPIAESWLFSKRLILDLIYVRKDAPICKIIFTLKIIISELKKKFYHYVVFIIMLCSHNCRIYQAVV